jgi:hypothetical protein
LRDLRVAAHSLRTPAGDEAASLAMKRDYHDPVDTRPNDDWLAAVEPIFVPRGEENPEDIGWAIVVQEKRADMLDPFTQVRSLVTRGAWTAAAMVVLVVGVLWGVVVLVMNPPVRRGKSRFFGGWVGGTTSTGSSSLGSRSFDHLEHPAEKK